MSTPPEERKPLPVLKLCNKINPQFGTEPGDGPLSSGDTRRDLVKRLQFMLKDLGFTLGSTGSKHDGVDGVFGTLTGSAVKEFQTTSKHIDGIALKVDALVGPRTADALNRKMVGIWYDSYQTPEELSDDFGLVTSTSKSLETVLKIQAEKKKKNKTRVVLVGPLHERELKVRWLVEELSIPISNEKGTRQATLLVSAQVLSEDDKGVPNKDVEFRISESSKEMAEKKKVKLMGATSSLDEARSVADGSESLSKTDDSGKAFCKVVTEFEENKAIEESEDPSELIGIELAMSTTVLLGPDDHVVADGGKDEVVGKEQMILVDSGKTPVTTAAKVESTSPAPTASTVLEEAAETLKQVAKAVLPRMKDVLRIAFKDGLVKGVIAMFPELSSTAQLAGISQAQLEACVAGYILGIPKGFFNNLKGTVQDIAFFVHDVPEMLFDFIFEKIKTDPGLLLELSNPITASTAVVEYAIKKGTAAYDFLQKHGKELQDIVSLVSKTLVANFSDIVEFICTAIYKSFETTLKPVVAWLRYPENGNEAKSFIFSFIIGDIVGYAVFELAVQAALALVTEGAGNAAKAVATVGRLFGAGTKAAEALEAIAKFAKIIVGFVRKMQREIAKGAEAIAKVFSSMMKFFVQIAEDSLKLFMKVLIEAAEKIDDLLNKFLEFVSHFFKEASSLNRIVECWEGFRLALADIGSKIVEIFSKLLSVLVKAAEKSGGTIGQGASFASKQLRKAVHAMTTFLTFGFEPLLMTFVNEIDGKELLDSFESFLIRVAVEADEVKDAILEINANEGGTITREQLIRNSLTGMQIMIDEDFEK